MIEYENLLVQAPETILLMKRFNKLLQTGWKIGNYPALNINERIEWQFIDEQERSWNYHKHCWAMLDLFLIAHSKLTEIIDLKPAIIIAIDWVRCNVTEDGRPIENLSKFAWYDMAVGLRAQRLAYIIDAARQQKLLSEQEDEQLWQALKAHQTYLENDENIAFHSNHGYYQAASQIAMGRRFKDIDPTMQTAMNQGIIRFRKILEGQFTSEGVHIEHSPDYHRMVYATLINMLSADLIADSEILDFTKKIEVSLSHFILPNQNLTNFGDTELRSMAVDSDTAKLHWQTPEMQYVVTNGEIGEAPKDYLTVYKEAGYYVVRANLQLESQRYDTYSYLAQNAAFHSRTHKHADDLSFVWYDRGHYILIDAGRYGYVGKTEMGSELWKQGYWYSHPYRVYCESTRAHNTLEFDEENYPRKGVKSYGSAIKRSVKYDNGLTVLETECKHFKSIRRVRVLIYMPGQWLIVYDWFKDNLNKNHDVRQWFNFAPEILFNKEESSYRAVLDDENELYVTSLLDGISSSEVMRGIEEPRLQGWYSTAEREFEPTSSFNLNITQKTTGSIATLFSFNELAEIDVSRNTVNISGRQMKVSWRDIHNKHSLQMSRDNNEVIKVNYQIIN